ncbi:MAG: exonuclease SbcCD subunit D C-terminal domain-containing protein, partial [Bacteroidota bacterium]
SPAMLNAPKELLESLNMHVIGTTTGNLDDEIIMLRDAKDKLQAVIAAIPFLRDKDLRSSISGETGNDRIKAIRAGIRSHYDAIGAACEKYDVENIPLVAVGHLYVKGSYAAEERANIYIGDKENIEAAQFPHLFDYVALGHIHRAQAFKGYEKVQYSGSLLPLSFSETKDEKIVKVVELNQDQLKVTDIPVPQFRRLKTIKMNFEAMKTRLLKLHEDYKDELPVWVDCVVTDEKSIPNLDLELREFVQDLNVDLLKIRTTFQSQRHAMKATEIDLKDLQPTDVFLQKCDAEGYNETEKSELLSSFQELQAWMIEKEKMN